MQLLPKIVFVQNQLEDMGGVSQFISLISRGLLARGYDIEIGAVSLPIDGRAAYYPPEIPTWTLCDVVAPTAGEFTGVGGEHRFRSARKQFEAQAAKNAAMRIADYDENTIVIFTQVFSRTMFAEAELDQPSPPPYRRVSQFHSSFQAARSTIDLHRILKFYADDDLFTCLTQEDANLFRKAGLNNATFVYNPVLPNDDGISSKLENPVVVSLSRYDPIKQVDHMVDAWSMLGDKVGDWQLHLYGSGPGEESLRSRIESRKLEDSVKLMGMTDRPIQVLSEASISINSSRHEGFGLAITEAASVGVPSVAYRCSAGIAEVIEDGVTGELVAPNDRTALSKALLKLIEDPALRSDYGAAAQQMVNEKFGFEKIIDEWERVLANVLR